MKKERYIFTIFVCIALLIMSGCTPAAYDAGYPEETESKEVKLQPVNIADYQSFKEVEVYLNNANTSSVNTEGKPYKLAWLCNDETDEQMAYMTNYMKEYAKEIGIELICFDGQSDPQKQIDQVNQSIIQQCDGLIICPIDSSALNIAMMKAMNEGIVVICSMMITSDDKYFDVFVGPSDTMVGQHAASMLLDYVPEGGQVAVIEGVMGAAAQINRWRGFSGVLKNYPQYEVVEVQTANWTTVEAMNVMESYLAKYPNLKAVYCENDAEALGALQAVQNAGRDDIIVLGSDGMQTVINLIGEGSQLCGTSLTPCALICETQTLAALACLNGDKEKLDKIIYTDNVCVVKDNAATIKSGWGGE